jgi:hypothetical protein
VAARSGRAWLGNKEEDRAMNTLIRAAALAAFMTVGLSAAAQAPAPKIQTPPNVALKWLDSLTISPATVSNARHAKGTVTLQRPAIQDMAINLCFIGGAPDEAFCYWKGVLILNRVVIRAGTDRVDFEFWSHESAGTGTVTVEARYQNESRTATLTITPFKSPGGRT